MAPLNIEAYHENSWKNRGTCEPGGWGRLRDMNPGGGTIDYLFYCDRDNSLSTVTCLEGGSYAFIDDQGMNIMMINAPLARRELLAGGEPYEVTIRSPENPDGRRVRFTHV